MATYAARGAELEKQVSTAGLPDEELTKLLPFLRGLQSSRDSALQAMLDVLDNTTPDQMLGVWKDRANALKQGYYDPLSNMLGNFTAPSQLLLLWRELTVTREAAWLAAVSDPKWVIARDDMNLFQAKLAGVTKDLTEKWSRLSDEDKRLEQSEADATARMTDALRKAVSDGTDTVNRASDSARKVLDAVDGLQLQFDIWFVNALQDAGVPDSVCEKLRTTYKDGKRLNYLLSAAGESESAYDIPFLTKRLSKYIVKLALKAVSPSVYYAYKAVFFINDQVLTPASEKYRQELAGYLAQLPSQGSVLVSFSSVREDVRKFLEDTNLEKIRTIYDQTSLALDNLDEAMPTDGLKSDTSAWAHTAREKFQKHFEAATAVYETFVRANQGRFVGKLDDSVANELIWTSVWLDRAQGLANIGMDQRLREWRNSTTDITLGFKKPGDQLRNAFLGLPIDVAEECQAALDEEWTNTFNDQQRQAEDLQKFLEQSEARWAADQLKKDLNRDSLKEKLPS